MRKILGLGLALGTLAFTGCAPVSSTWGYGPGLQLGISPTGQLNLFNSQCSMLGSPGMGSPFSRTGSAAAVAMTRMQQVSQIQSKFMSFSAGSRTYIEDWKGIAGGGC